MYSHAQSSVRSCWLVLAFVASLLLPLTAVAQDKTSVPLTDPSRPSMVKVSLVDGSIIVKGYEGKEIQVEAQNRNDGGGLSKEGGMKRVPLNGTGLAVEEENNNVEISASGSIHQSVDVTVLVPFKTSLHLRTVNDGDITVTDVEGELDVTDVNGQVTLQKVSGYAVAHALNRKLTVVFDRINPDKPMAFSSFNDDVDVTFPPDLKANVTISTDHGQVFSDFDVQLATHSATAVPTGKREGGKYRVQFEKTIQGTINGGGQLLQFKNYDGNIYIRMSGGSRSSK